MTIRLLIADDHEVVRTGLASLLQGTEIDVGIVYGDYYFVEALLRRKGSFLE